MRRSIWIHAGAYGEIKAALPLLDALRVKYPNIFFEITVGGAEGLGVGLKNIRLILGEMSWFQVFWFFFTQRPLLWISSTYVMEAKALLACSCLNIPVIYLFEGYARTNPRWFKKRLLRFALRTTIGLVTQTNKQRQFETLGMPAEQIKKLKNLKLVI